MYLFIIYLYAYYIEVYGNIVLEVFLIGNKDMWMNAINVR